jgi:hypothetical protein
MSVSAKGRELAVGATKKKHMPAQTKNVFIDTEVFDRHHLDVFSPNFKRIIRLGGSEELNVVLTDVTLGEIRNHIDKFAKTAFKQFSDYRRVNRVLKEFVKEDDLKGFESVTEESLRQRLQEEFNRFLMVTAAEVVSVDSVSPNSVFESYFQAKPPFNDTNKKLEFPDAFAGAALRQWCEQVKNRRLYIVTGDPDWRRLSAEVPSFIHVRTLEELLEEFADAEIVADLKEAINSQSDRILSTVTEKVEAGDIFFFVDDSMLDGEVDTIENVDAEISEVRVVEAQDGTAVLNLTFDVKVALVVRGDNPDSGYTDPDTKEWRSLGPLSGTIERDIKVDASIDVTYNVANPKEISIKSIEFREEGVEISVEDNELQEDDEYDVDEPEPESEPTGE